MSLTNSAIDSGPTVTSVDLGVLAALDGAQEEGEPDFVVELIELYLKEAPRLFSLIHDGLTNDYWLNATRAAHSLRGSSGNLGIMEIASLAGDLEHLAPNDTVTARKLLLELEEEFSRVEAILIEERRRRTL